MVAGLKGAGYLERCVELGLETLEKRRQDQDMALVYKFISQPSLAGQSLFDIQNGARTRQTAGRLGLAVQSARMDQRKYSIAVRSVECWSRLPESVKSAENGESFKRRLKRKPE
jgi:hypothetical protein